MKILLDNKKFLALAILTLGFLVSVVIVYGQSASRNSSISLKKDGSLFVLAISDPDGIKEFSLEARQQGNYGGGLAGCPTTFNSKNIIFKDPEDFTPFMKAVITDCRNNILEFELLAPEDGITRGKLIVPEGEKKEAPSAIAPTSIEEKPVPKPTKSLENVQYPVNELGGCASEEACRVYCDDRSHADVCLAFAKEHGLVSEEDYDYAQRFKNIDGGPGGCRSRNACETYCNDIKNLDECIAFAEANDVFSEKELAGAKKFQQIVKSGGKTPGGCTGRQSCEAYCNNTEHMEECIAFGEETDFLSGEELSQARKFLELMRGGETPGGCRNREQCENYCNDENNLEECIAFAEKAGFASKEEIEMFKKTGGRGPGGCKGKAQCEAYCEANQEECFNWANEHGVMREEDLARMREGFSQFREQLQNMPPQVVDCFKEQLGEDVYNKILTGEPVFARDLGEKMKMCFEKLAESFGGDGGFPGGPGGFPGPGGNHDGFQGAAGEFSGPGGCKSVQECTQYCIKNYEACKGFVPPSSGSGFPSGDQRGFPGSAPDGTKAESYSGPTYGQDFDLKCDPGWEVSNDNAGRKYCAITQEKCSELHSGTVLTTDEGGHRVCIQQSYEGNIHDATRSAEVQEQYEEQYRQQYQSAPLPTGTTHDTAVSAEVQKQYEQQYQQQYEQQYQQQLPAAPNKSFLGRIADTLLNLFR